MQYLKLLGIYLFSTWVWIISFISMFIVFWIAVIYWVTTNPAILKLEMYFFECILYFTCSRKEVIYHPGFDPNRVSLYCQNHVSILDAFVASAAIPSPFCGIMQAWQFKIPIYGWIMKLSGGIGIYRNQSKSFERLVHAIKYRAEKVFPY